MVSASGSIVGSSSHRNGVDTWAPTRERAHHARIANYRAVALVLEHVIAGRGDVDSRGEELVKGFLGDAFAARAVLHVGDEKIYAVLLAQRGEQGGNGLPARLANDVSNHQDAH